MSISSLAYYWWAEATPYWDAEIALSAAEAIIPSRLAVVGLTGSDYHFPYYLSGQGSSYVST